MRNHWRALSISLAASLGIDCEKADECKENSLEAGLNQGGAMEVVRPGKNVDEYIWSLIHSLQQILLSKCTTRGACSVLEREQDKTHPCYQ